MQDSMTGGIDRASKVRELVREENALAFENTLQDSMTTEEGEIVAIILDNANEDLYTVAQTLFPYCNMVTQYLWMNRKMFKFSSVTNNISYPIGYDVDLEFEKKNC
jgi:hypothetical protein